jgi:hypothetical protein
MRWARALLWAFVMVAVLLTALFVAYFAVEFFVASATPHGRFGIIR